MTWLKANNQFQKQTGDTPTDALQLVNKKYVDTNTSPTYAGAVTGGTGAKGTPFPAGWSAAKTGTGEYAIVHHLGTAAYAPLVSPVGSGGGATPNTISASSFGVFTFNTLTGSATNLDFVFTVTEG